MPLPWSAKPVRTSLDVELVHKWMNQPHVARFWNQAWSLDKWTRHLDELARDSYVAPLLIAHRERPVCYLELYRAARHFVAEHYGAHPHDVGVHIAIGETQMKGKGLGTQICRSMFDAIFSADPSCRRIVTEPDVRNDVARKLFRGLGMHLVGEIQLPHKRAALYALGSTVDDVPHTAP